MFGGARFSGPPPSNSWQEYDEAVDNNVESGRVPHEVPCTHVQARQSCHGFVCTYIFCASGDGPFAVKFAVVLARGHGSLIVAHTVIMRPPKFGSLF
jgi:hypothetical protein